MNDARLTTTARTLGLGCALLVAACSGSDPATGGTKECGNGVRIASEQCDGSDLAGETCVTAGYDGGTLACSTSCTFDFSGCVGTPPSCGDASAEGLEECDGADLAGFGCTDLGYDGGTLACNADCTYDESACTGTPAACGDGSLNGLEDCEGTDVGGTTCADLGFGGGTLACSALCTFDTSGCTAATCGDGVVNQAAEECDGNDLDGSTCQSEGFQGGFLVCTTTCTLNTSSCFGSTATCGDALAEGPELCDGDDLRGETCVTQGYDGGTLACAGDCTYDYGACVGTAPLCGDGAIDGTEECDGADLGGFTCADFGFTGGTLACAGDCTYDVTGCTFAGGAVCGDGTAQGTELCDGADLRGQTCESLGAGTGTLGCLGNCSDFDYSGCTAGPVCGDGVREGSEICDGTDVPALPCMFFGYTSGTVTACLPSCKADLSACGAPTTCGTAEQGTEQCDGTELYGATCESLGFTGGTLACNTNCSYDTSGCTL